MSSTNNPSAEAADALGRLQNVWESHAKDDALWAIASSPQRKDGKWDVAEFFTTGVIEIDRLLATLASNDIAFDSAAALDFGCGVGRLSQALAPHFQSVCGVDISPTMIAMANRLNQHPDKCRFVINAEQDLALFRDESFSFTYSNMVLQHIPPDLTRKYLVEFGRVLKPDGLLIFQLPSRFTVQEGLPDAAWKCILRCECDAFSFPSSARTQISVEVKNDSPVAWEYDPQLTVMLGNHWLDADGNLLRLDDGRAMLPNPFKPGDNTKVDLTITTPPSPGRYFLELDLVQESVAWFKDKGSDTLRLPVEIAEQTPQPVSISAQPDSTVAEPIASPNEAFAGFSMHCIPRPEVIQLLDQNNLRLDFIQPSDAGGPGYQSYLYFARKRPR